MGEGGVCECKRYHLDDNTILVIVITYEKHIL